MGQMSEFNIGVLMKPRFKKTFLASFVLFILMAGIVLRSTAQEKPKEIAATKPVEVQFSPSDAIRISKLRATIQEANSQIMTILGTYNIGSDGEFISDKEGNWIGVRKAEPKKP